MFVYIIAIVMCMYDCNTGVNYVVNSITILVTQFYMWYDTWAAIQLHRIPIHGIASWYYIKLLYTGHSQAVS